MLLNNVFKKMPEVLMYLTLPLTKFWKSIPLPFPARNTHLIYCLTPCITIFHLKCDSLRIKKTSKA